MGKLHGLTIGLDICSTLHMAVTLEDLDWCQDQLMPAAPAYLMALPTKNDPMLSYLTTSYQDHVRLRQKFGTRVNDSMWDFYERIGIVDGKGRYTEHFGDPVWVYYQYCVAKGDRRSREAITAEGRGKIREVEARGVDIATGHGKEIWDLNPELHDKVKSLYEDAKVSLRAEFTPEFTRTITNALCIATMSRDRDDYIAHPVGGEQLSPTSIAALEKLRASWGTIPPVAQIVISDGLNARAIMDDNHLAPYLDEVGKLLAERGISMSGTHIVVTSGRVRAGYRIGELLFGQTDPETFRGILHIIGERPGTMHHSYSIYITMVRGGVWAEKKIDHDITRLVCNVADTALDPRKAAGETITILRELMGKKVKGTRKSGAA
jgi:ethanolamine ammonia-lyase large subunit